MRARTRMVPLVALVSVLMAGSLVAYASPTARLVEVRPQVGNGRVSVLIEASDPVAYAASQPDPLTVLVDLRNVSSTGVSNRFAAAPVGPVAAVEVGEGQAVDGAAVTRVRLGLAAPRVARVRGARNTIIVEFDREGDGLEGLVAVQPGPVGDGKTDTAPMVRASKLSMVSTELVDGSVRVTLKGDGRLVPGNVQEARDLPHRVVVDFPGVATAVPAVTPVGAADVERVRVALNSSSPLVTRVVFDLKKRLPYRIDTSSQDSGEIVVVLGSQANQTPAGVAAPAPAVVAPPPAAPPAADTVERLERAVVAMKSTPAAPTPPPVAASVPPPPPVAAPPPPPPPSPEPAVASSRPVDRPAGAEPVLKPSAAVPAAARAADPVETLKASPVARAVETQAAAQGQVIGEPAAERRFTGHPISLDFQGVDLRAVLRTFADITGLNIVIDPQVQGTVDVALRDVPWDQALDIILRANQLGYNVDGTIVRVAPLKTLADEEAQRRKLADEKALAGELKVMTRTLSYARATDVADLVVKSSLSQRGLVQVDERTNTLIITDLPGRLDLASDLLTTLDRPEPQVEIEARIVQTTSEFARSLGVQWGFSGYAAPEFGNTTNLAFPNSGSITGRTRGVQGDGRVEVPTGVNLGAVNPTSAIGLALSSVNGAFNLDVALTALERAGKGRILSTPRVATQNNVEAEVTQGVQIPIQTVANNTVTVQFKDAALTLRVKPQITAANTVIMKIVLENASPDYSRQVNGIPPIDTQRANTEVLVRDGATTVIGGIFVSREASIKDRTPGLYRLPLLGWLFKRDSIQDESRELLIFITPRIIKG